MATSKVTPKPKSQPKSQPKPRSTTRPVRGAKRPPLSAEVAALVARHPPAMRKALLALRAQVLAAAPGASDAVAWRMPMITHGGKHLVGYEAFKAHCTLFPMSASIVERFAAELGERVGGRGSIHFTPDDPLPPALVKRIVTLRLAELAAKATARRRR